MFYIMYLTGLCHRRHWPDPVFLVGRTRQGYVCTVVVNGREYSTDVHYETDELAKNAAATSAYMMCRNFSVNDGMYPGQRSGPGGIIQGLPVAIGMVRRNACSSNDYSSGETFYSARSSQNSDGSTSVTYYSARSSQTSDVPQSVTVYSATSRQSIEVQDKPDLEPFRHIALPADQMRVHVLFKKHENKDSSYGDRTDICNKLADEIRRWLSSYVPDELQGITTDA